MVVVGFDCGVRVGFICVGEERRETIRKREKLLWVKRETMRKIKRVKRIKNLIVLDLM